MVRSSWAFLSVHVLADPLDESSMLQMPVVQKSVETDASECACPGYFREQCEENAFQGCVWTADNLGHHSLGWTDQGDSNAPWCQCDPNFDGTPPLFRPPNPEPHSTDPVIPQPGPTEPEPPVVVCCMAMTASCLSCSAGVTEEQYCAENPLTDGCPEVDLSGCCSASGFGDGHCADALGLGHVFWTIAGHMTDDYTQVGTTYHWDADQQTCSQTDTVCCFLDIDISCVACQHQVHADDFCGQFAADYPQLCLTGEDCCGVASQPEGCALLDYPIAMGHGFTGDYREVSSTVEWTGNFCMYNDIGCCHWESVECMACMHEMLAEDFCLSEHRDDYPQLCGPPFGEACCVASPPDWCADADYLRAIGDGWTTDYTQTGVVYNWNGDTCFEMHTWCCADPHDVGCVACQNNAHPEDFCAAEFTSHPDLCPMEMDAHCCVESPPEVCDGHNFQIHASSMRTTRVFSEVFYSIGFNGHACNEEHVVCCDWEEMGCVACQMGIHPDVFCDEHALDYRDLCAGHPSLPPDDLSLCCAAQPADNCEHAEPPLLWALGHGTTTDYTQVGDTYTFNGMCLHMSTVCCWDSWDIGCVACMNQVAPEDFCNSAHAAENPQLCLTGEDCCMETSARPDGCDQVIFLHALGMGSTSDFTQVGTTFEWSGGVCTETYLGCCHDNSRSCSACREGVAADDLCDDHAAAYPDFCIPVDQAPAGVCPDGWEQRGEIGADIGGCGLQSCDQRYDLDSEAACAARCDENDACMGFSYAPMNGDRNHPGVTACTIYNSDIPTGTWTGTQGIATQVFCGRTAGNIATAGPIVHVLIDNSNDNTKCVTAPVAVICADDAGHLGNRINSHTAGDTFDITVGGDDRNEVCATRTDSSGGWGMHLEIACVSAPVHVLIGSSSENQKCVTYEFPVVCAGDAGHLGNRINSHQAGDTFDITTEGDEVCAVRTDSSGGWGMNLEIACVAASMEEIAGQIVAGPPVNILIGNSDTNEQCVNAPYDVICASDAGHLGNRVNVHSADDQFEVTTPAGGPSFIGCYVDDGSRDLEQGPMQYGYTIASCADACSDYDYFALQNNGWCVCGDAYGTESQYSLAPDTDCGNPCAGDTTGHCGGPWRNAVYQTESSQVCARRLDGTAGWGMQLEITCVAAPVIVLLGNSDDNTKCVTASTSVTCADDAGHLGNRVNTHPAGDTFLIESAGSRVCATRTDSSGGWGMQLEIACVVNPGCSNALVGGGIHTSGVPDGASAIQFLDYGHGAMQNGGIMTSVSYRMARGNQAGLKFQVYRPTTTAHHYTLIMESDALSTSGSGTMTVALDPPLVYEAGDYIGWVHNGQGTFNFQNSGGNVRWKYGIEPVGSTINFNGQGPRTYAYEASFSMC